jgi:hypothetical protein
LGNQPERIVGLDFIGGLITGEGCFCLAVQRIKARKGNLRITPVFDLYMADRETVTVVSESLRVHGLPVYVAERPKAGRDQVGIHASGMLRVKKYCDTFIPHLTGQKKRAAELVLKYIESRLAETKGSQYTDEQLAIVTELRSVNGNTNGKKTPL